MQLNEFKSPTIYVDLDGVMSDLRGKWSQLIGEPFTQERYLRDRDFRNRVWRETNRALKRGEEVWYDLDLMPDAMVLWRFLVQHKGTVGYDLEILTATGRSHMDKIRDMKHRWVAEKLSSTVKVNTTRDGVDKAEYAGDGKILIDDQQKNIDAWERAGGTGVFHTDAESTINKLRKILHGTL